MDTFIIILVSSYCKVIDFLLSYLLFHLVVLYYLFISFTVYLLQFLPSSTFDECFIVLLYQYLFALFSYYFYQFALIVFMN